MRMQEKIRQEINKKRWERWRAKQKNEREKTYFHCWDEWGEWSDVCEDSQTKYCAHAALEATLYRKTMKVKIHYYGVCCLGTDCGLCIYECSL